MKKIKGIFDIVFRKRKVTSYEQNISTLNYSIFKTIIHYCVIFTGGAVFYFSCLCLDTLHQSLLLKNIMSS